MGDYPGLCGWALNPAVSILITERQREFRYTQKRTMQPPCDHGGRDWSNAAPSQGMPAATGSWKGQGTDSPQSLQWECSLAHSLNSAQTDWFLIFRTVREYISGFVKPFSL